MKRIDFLKTQSEEKAAASKLENVAKREKNLWSKKVADLKFELEQLEFSLEERLTDAATLDESTILTNFADQQKLEAKIALFESFLNKYY